MDACFDTSRATMMPIRVTINARSFDSIGIVRVGVFVGSKIMDIKIPPIMLPKARRVIEFSNAGLFSLIGCRAWFRVVCIWT